MANGIIHLQNPDLQELTNAYRTLPRFGEINLFISLEKLADTLNSMESAGFIGIKITYLNVTSGSANISAYKAKNGACYDTGRFVIYNGAALAAFDDDNHLLISGKQTAVCEKTANIYKLVAYENLVTCTDPDPSLLAKLNDQPSPFNCDTFEDDNEAMFKMVNESSPGSKFVSMFYPGPFRLLVMNDGRIIRRGEVTAIPVSESELLFARDGLFRSSVSIPAEPSFFRELYKLSGARCLLDKKLIRKNSEVYNVTDFESLKNISETLKDQLLKLIQEGKKYFILTGSDKDDKLGCCPSEMVTEANRLTRAGILDSFGQSPQDDSCTVTTYAFRNEINVVDDEPVFRIDSSFRLQVKEILEKKRNGRLGQLSRWILLVFIAISLIIAFLKIDGSSDSPDPKSLFEQLAPVIENQKMVVLFHFKERCSICLNMERYVNEVLNENYPELVAGKKIQFKLITMDQPENKNLVERFELFSATIVLVQFEDKQEKKIKVLTDGWEYYQDENMFKNIFKQELDQFLNEQYE
jgi:hypothetical protein